MSESGTKMTTKKRKTKTKTKTKIQEVEKPNPGSGGSTSATPPPPPPPSPPDKISELPNEILHHILGFLEMDELLIQTSLVSTKWRNLWKSVSKLNFPRCLGSSSSSSRRRRTSDDSVAAAIAAAVADNGSIRNNVEKYQNFVDNVLRLRDSEASKIQIFNYYCHDDSNSNSNSNSTRRRRGGAGAGYGFSLERIHNFIVSAVVNQGAQEIHINLFHLNNSNIHSNPCIFNSGQLRVFNFQVNVPFRVDYGIHFPNSMCCATHLTHLSLDGIRLPAEGDDSNAQFHLVCPVLETFRMNSCITKHLKVLDISAPKLNTLSICNVGMRYEDFDFDRLGKCRIELHTPNLTSLHYSGPVYVDCFTENLPHVADAILDFGMNARMLEITTSFAIKLLKGLTSAKSLALSGFQVSSSDTLKNLFTPFTSLRNLRLLTTGCEISSIHWMVHILNNCNSIENFIWEVYEPPLFVQVEGDEQFPQCRLSHLKHVHINGLCGHENEIKFVKFLLRSSVVLEDLIINTSEDSPKQEIEENLKQIIEEEPLFSGIKLCVL